MFRTDTTCGKLKVVMMLGNGGMGDYVQFCQAIKYSILTYEHMHGVILVHPYFYEIAHHLLHGVTDRFKVIACDNFTKYVEKVYKQERIFFIQPEKEIGMNHLSFSTMKYAFAYYCWLDKIPKEYNQYPALRLDDVDISKYKLPEKYFVVTTYATSPTRTLPPKVVNEICEYLNSNGITPVFLGKDNISKDMANVQDKKAIDYKIGIDLRNDTSLLKAAKIMENAVGVVGIDNGLLHLASCTKANIIWGFTTVKPEHRLIDRPHFEGNSYVIAPGEELGCRFCQSRMKFVIGHEFGKCFYSDLKCIEALSFDKFKIGIDMILGINQPEAKESL